MTPVAASILMESFEYYSDANFHHVRRVLESLMRTNPGEVR